MVSVPFGSSEPAIQRLRAVDGLGRRQEPGAAAAVAQSPQRMLDLARRDQHMRAAVVAIFAASILVRMPPRDRSDCRRARHRLDRRGDGDDGISSAGSCAGRRG